MYKKKITRKKVNKTIFYAILHSKKLSLESFDTEPELYICKDAKQTIYRNLKHPDGFRSDYLDKIGKALDLDPNYLSGKLFFSYHFNSLERYLSVMNRYPYAHKDYANYQKQNIKHFLSSVLALFDISYTQFEEFDFDKQIAFQKELLTGISNTIGKHFDRDDSGSKEMYQLDKILFDLEDYAEDHAIQEYAENVLRPEYLRKPPFIYTRDGKKKMVSREEIANMSADAIFDLGRFTEPPTPDELELRLHSKYKRIESDEEEE